MKKTGIILGLLLLSLVTVVYAHGQQNNELEYMEEIELHEEMMKDIHDPRLIEYMESMHESCEGDGNRFNWHSIVGMM